MVARSALKSSEEAEERRRGRKKLEQALGVKGQLRHRLLLPRKSTLLLVEKDRIKGQVSWCWWESTFCRQLQCWRHKVHKQVNLAPWTVLSLSLSFFFSHQHTQSTSDPSWAGNKKAVGRLSRQSTLVPVRGSLIDHLLGRSWGKLQLNTLVASATVTVPAVLSQVHRLIYK